MMLSDLIPHTKIVMAMKVLEMFVGETVLSEDYTVGAFSNCREQGFRITNWDNNKSCAFSENRNSDDIVVYHGTHNDFDYMTNKPNNEHIWMNARCFRYDDFEGAVKFIREHLDTLTDGYNV